MAESLYRADLQNGTYLNPIVFGNFADPSVLRDGDLYYLVHGGPGYRRMRLWRSADLVNWEHLYPIVEGDSAPVSCWAPELVKVDNTYYLYNYGGDGMEDGAYVLTCTDIEAGDWSGPTRIDGVSGIDPGHTVDPDGNRFLFMSGNVVYPLADDGLSVAGEGRQVLDHWPIPDEWDIECICAESPKLTWHNDWLYLTTAQGGTVGPPTSHMIISARARSALGPWEYSPFNPICRTTSREERWWSKGHGTLVEGPDRWYVLYHAILNGRRGLGRMTLMEPVEWTADGWWRIPESSSPDSPERFGFRSPTGDFVLSDNFSGESIGPQWDPVTEGAMKRLAFDDGNLVMNPIGTGLHDTIPLLCLVPSARFTVEADLVVEPDAIGGITFYYDSIHSCGIALSNGNIMLYNLNKYWLHQDHNMIPWDSDSISLRLATDGYTVSPWYSADRVEWRKLNICFDVEGWHGNAVTGGSGGYGSLRPGLFAAGSGRVRVMSWRVRR